MTTDEWVTTYARAWNEADAAAAASLFTEDAKYYSSILGEPAVGAEGVAGYWRDVTATQSEIDARLGAPIVMGSRVAVEFWTRLRNAGQPITLMGCMLLRLAPDGRCEELREYWNLEEGTHAPPDFWGR